MSTSGYGSGTASARKKPRDASSTKHWSTGPWPSCHATLARGNCAPSPSYAEHDLPDHHRNECDVDERARGLDQQHGYSLVLRQTRNLLQRQAVPFTLPIQKKSESGKHKALQSDTAQQPMQ